MPKSTAARDARAYFTRDDLCRHLGIARATSYRWEALGYLPKPVRFGPGAARWPRAEIEALEKRAAEDRGAQP